MIRALGEWLALVAAVVVGGRAALAWKDVDEANEIMRALDARTRRGPHTYAEIWPCTRGKGHEGPCNGWSCR